MSYTTTLYIVNANVILSIQNIVLQSIYLCYMIHAITISILFCTTQFHLV